LEKVDHKYFTKIAYKMKEEISLKYFQADGDKNNTGE